MLELNDVFIVVGGSRRLSALSLLLADGQSLLLTGADEAVRSAVVQAMLGLKPVAGGHVLIDGERVTPTSAPCFRSQTAYVPSSGQWPDDTVHDLVDRLCRLRHHAATAPSPGALRKEWEAMGVEADVSDKRVGELSEETRQLLMLAVARLMGKQRVLVEEVSTPRVSEVLRQLAAEGRLVVATASDSGVADGFSQHMDLDKFIDESI
ncbi:MAG: ATP-binding cassette domain-containing protein [Prevotella sp.]